MMQWSGIDGWVLLCGIAERFPHRGILLLFISSFSLLDMAFRTPIEKKIKKSCQPVKRGCAYDAFDERNTGAHPHLISSFFWLILVVVGVGTRQMKNYSDGAPA